MKEQHSIKKNYLYSMAYQILIMILPLITAPYLARVVGAEGTGIYSYTYSIAQYFLYFAMLGISNHGNRSIAKVREDKDKRIKVFSEIYTLQMITAITALICYLLYCVFIVHINKEIALIQTFFVMSSVFDISWLFWGMENFKVTVTRQIMVKIATAIGIFVFVKSPDDLWKYTLLLSAGTLLSTMYLFVKVKQYVVFRFQPLRNSFQNLKPVLILFIPIIATSIYRVMDKVMIGLMSDMVQVGYYENSDKLITTCLGVVGSLGSVMLPRMSNLVAKGDKEAQNQYLLKSIEATMFIAFAIAFGIASVADSFIPFFYGSKFNDCILITRLLTISVPFISWANVVRMQFLIPNEKDRIYVTSIIVGAILNVFINYNLIPLYGAAGAAIGTICAEATVMLIQTVCSRTEIDVPAFIKKSVPFLAFGFIMFFGVRILANILNKGIISMLAQIFVGALVYVSLSGVYFIATKNPIVTQLARKLHIMK